MKFKFLFFLFIATFLFSCEKKEEPTESTLYGIITDLHTLEPIQGASVIIFEGADINTSQTTGSDGRYNIIITKDITGYSDFIRVFCMGYEPIETSNFDLPLGSNRQMDFQLIPNENEDGSGGGALASVEVEFFNPSDYVFGNPYLVVKNNSGSELKDVFIQLDLISASSSNYTINIPSFGAYTIKSYYRVFWFYGDKVTVTINGKSKSWTYSS